ncbi:unnamed protein product [Effrenium voratum]|nr:unnamed protein product [Effrenium voratum]
MLRHFKLAGVNWYGASDSYHVVPWLNREPSAEDICHSVAAMGFTVVRLPFSSEMLRVQSVPEGAIDYSLNGELKGLTPLQVYDRVIEQLGLAGVTVMINNHTTVGAWSGGVELNGMWFRDQCEIYTEQSWINDWVMMAKRYKDMPQVVGYDIRNEVRPTTMTGPSPRWGSGEKLFDWSRAAGSCARALMDAAAPGVIVVERIAWPQNSLREMLKPPPWEAWGVPRDRIVLSVHMYAWSGPGSWSPKHFMPVVLRSFFDVVDYVGSRSLYGEMSEELLEQQMDQDFGFCLNEDICPVWLSELGADLSSGELDWFLKVCKYLEKRDVDFAYWPLNVGPKPGGSDDEAYGILTNDWQPRWADRRLQALRRLCPQPSVPRKSLPARRALAAACTGTCQHLGCRQIAKPHGSHGNSQPFGITRLSGDRGNNHGNLLWGCGRAFAAGTIPLVPATARSARAVAGHPEDKGAAGGALPLEGARWSRRRSWQGCNDHALHRSRGGEAHLREPGLRRLCAA